MSPHPHAASAARFAATLLATAALWLLVQAFSGLPCWTAILPAALAAWPVWQYQGESALIQRRAILSSVALEDSRLRRWLWRGRLSLGWQACVALAWAALLLAFGMLLAPLQWAVLAADAVLLVLLAGWVRRRLAGEVHEAFLGPVTRRWPLAAANVTALTLGFLALDIALGVPDTRGFAWDAVAQRAFAEGSAAAACPAAGWLAGILAAADRLAWHAYEVIAPGLPGSGLKAGALLFFLLQAGLLSIAFTRLLLGAMALAEARGAPAWAAPGERRATRVFLPAMLLLLALWLAALHVLRDVELSRLGSGARAGVALVNPCRGGGPGLRSVHARSSGELQAWRAGAHAEARQRIGERIDSLYAGIEFRVDRYLDWYFSIIGEYQRLFASAGLFPDMMAGELQRQLFDGIRFEERVDAASREIAASAAAQAAALAARLGAQIEAGARGDPCRFDALDLREAGEFARRDWQRALGASGAGVAAGAVTARMLATRAAAATAARLAAGNTMKAAGSLAGRVSARRGGAIVLSAAGAAAACAPGGPLAVLCSLAAGAATWLTVDKALITIDELRFREKMRAEILDAVNEQRRTLEAGLIQANAAAIDHAAAAVGESLERVFLPLRDAL